MSNRDSSWQLNRRHFLEATAGSLAASALSANASFAADKTAELRGVDLGFSLYGMKTLSLSDALKTCGNIGYSHVEFALLDGFPTAPDVFSTEHRKAAVNQLQTLQLRLPCLMINISLMADDKAHAAALETISKASKMSHELYPKDPPIIETVLGGKPDEWENQKARMAERLHDWAHAAEKGNVIIAIKAHVNSGVNSPERLLWLLDQVKSPAIQVAYDYSHFELAGMDMEETMKALLPRTKFIHVKDTVGDSKKFQFLLPGEGKTDYVKYFSLLKKHQYTGPVCVEVSAQVFNKPDYEPVAAAKRCYGALSAAIAKQ